MAEKDNNFRVTELLPISNGVLNTIRLSLRKLNWRSGQPISTQDILFPTILIQSQNYDQTKEVLRKVGLQSGLSAAYIKRDGQEVEENPVIRVSGQQLDSPENFKGYSHYLDLRLGNLLPQNAYTYIVFKVDTQTRTTAADVCGLDADSGIKVSLGRIYVGEDPVTGRLKPAGEGVLLIDGDNPQNISSVLLPKNWRRAVDKDGRLFTESK